MSHLLAFALCLAGFVLLALAMDRQQRDLFGRPLPPRTIQVLRIGGICALTLAVGSLVVVQGWGLALVAFSGHTSLAAGLTYCGLIGCKRHTVRRDAAK